MARAVSDLLGSYEWPSDGAKIWHTIGSAMRPDRITQAEKRVITKLLDSDSVRERMFDLLGSAVSVKAYRVKRQGRRGEIERHVLLTGVAPELTRSPEDRIIGITARAIEAYESVSIAFQQAFDSVRWALTRAGGVARPEALLTERPIVKALDRALSSLRKSKLRLDKASIELALEAALNRPELLGPLESIRNEASVAVTSGAALVGTILERHERVQKAKRKAVWIDRGASWTLMPGFGFAEEAPPNFDASYLHPFRVQNAYSFLSDLGKVFVATGDADAS